MDAVLIALALVGTLAGLLAMALPGVHVNALALAVLALAPDSSDRGAAFLLGAFTGAPFGLALSGTFVGATSDDHALASLPARALAREGRAAQAVALQCWGAFAGLALGLALALAARPLVTAVPLASVLPWLLLGVLALLVVTTRARPRVHRRWVVVPWRAKRIRYHGQEGLRDPHGLLPEPPAEIDVEARWETGPLSWPVGMLLAAGALALSGWLGVVALRAGTTSPLGLPSSALLPLLAGLFAVPTLLPALRATRAVPRGSWRVHAPARGEILHGAAPGALVASLLGFVPGVTASHVAPLAGRARSEERALIRLGAVNGAAVAFALLVWHALGKARHGALIAAGKLSPVAPWATWAPTPELLGELALVLLAAGLACLAARAGARPLARVPPRPLAWAGLALVLVMTVATCGAWGLAVLFVGALVGHVPARLHVSRSLLMGCILVPAALRAWGLA